MGRISKQAWLPVEGVFVMCPLPTDDAESSSKVQNYVDGLHY